MTLPKISIVTPVYNQAAYLEETILSVILQGYPNLEYIIVDGGSTDGTVEIINKYANNLAWWVSEPDNGIYFALQKGFEQSTGEIMGWINSDDLLAPRSLYTIADAFATAGKVKWITGIPVTIDKTGRIVNILNVRQWSKYNYILKDFHVIQQESTYWARELWDKAGGGISITYKYASDLELWTRFFKYEKLYSVTAAIGSFRARPGEQLSSIYLQQYLAEADSILSSMEKTEHDLLVLKKIHFYNKYPRLLKFSVNQSKYRSLFDYTELIQYSVQQQKFILT